MRPTDKQTGLTQERLKSLLHYEPETGVFTWKVWRPNGIKIGDAAGAVHPVSGYRIIKVNARSYLASRLAWLYMTGEWPADLIDHKDTDRQNNAWQNLRAATYAENMHNRNVQHTSGSGIKGVRFKTGRTKPWEAHIRIDGRLKYLGNFANPEDAHAAYTKAASTAFGSFARN